jgi:hypothetical protein
MTALATAFKTFESKGNREDLQNAIYNIDPTDVPFTSNAGRGRMKATLTEWQIDSLDAATTDNAQLEADDVTQYPTLTPTTRVGNYAQISRKLLAISDRLEEVDRAGRESEEAFQTIKKIKSLKRDIETIILDNHASSAGAAATAPVTAPLPAWLKTNIVMGAGGVNPTYTSGVPGAARTDGTTAAFTEVMLQTAMAAAFNSGSMPDTLMVGAGNKRVVSTFSGIATKTIQQTAVKPAAIIGSADFYVSEFGTLAVVPNRFQRNRDAWLLDFDFVSLLFLRNFRTTKLAKSGDAEKRMILVDWALKVHNEAALAAVYDLT